MSDREDVRFGLKIQDFYLRFSFYICWHGCILYYFCMGSLFTVNSQVILSYPQLNYCIFYLRYLLLCRVIGLLGLHIGFFIGLKVLTDYDRLQIS